MLFPCCGENPTTKLEFWIKQKKLKFAAGVDIDGEKDLALKLKSTRVEPDDRFQKIVN